MSMGFPPPRSPVVFISYAHESDALRASVKDLADWLSRKGCTVLTDHLHPYKPPSEGWLAWMQGCIRQAEAVRHHLQAQSLAEPQLQEHRAGP